MLRRSRSWVAALVAAALLGTSSGCVESSTQRPGVVESDGAAAQQPFGPAPELNLKPAERFLFGTLRTAGEHQSPEWARTSLRGLALVADPTRAVVLGRATKIRPGRGYLTPSGLWGPPGAAAGPGTSARAVPWGASRANLWVARLTIDVERVLGLPDPPPKLIVAVVLNRPNLGVLRRALTSLDQVVLVLGRGGNYSWAPRLRPIQDGALFGVVDQAGSVTFPALGSDSSRFAQDAEVDQIFADAVAPTNEGK